jgi:hypothetical protein
MKDSYSIHSVRAAAAPEALKVFDYGTNCLEIVHRESGNGNAVGVSSGITCTSV